MDVTSYLLGKQAGGGSTPTLQDKSVTITENGTTNVTADTGYDGLSEVEITTNVSGGGIDDYFNKNTTRANFSNGFASLILKQVPSGITLPSGLTSLTEAFSAYMELETVELFDTSNVTVMNSMFNNCIKLKNVPKFNTERVTSFNSMFRGCSVLETVPSFNSSACTNFNSMFHSCGMLKNIPIFDFSSVTGSNNLKNMITYCYNLTDQSLDNLLVSCTTATNYTGTKTLANLGLYYTYTDEKIQALPHYQDFINAGWTIS